MWNSIVTGLLACMSSPFFKNYISLNCLPQVLSNQLRHPSLSRHILQKLSRPDQNPHRPGFFGQDEHSVLLDDIKPDQLETAAGFIELMNGTLSSLPASSLETMFG